MTPQGINLPAGISAFTTLGDSRGGHSDCDVFAERGPTATKTYETVVCCLALSFLNSMACHLALFWHLLTELVKLLDLSRSSATGEAYFPAGHCFLQICTHKTTLISTRHEYTITKDP